MSFRKFFKGKHEDLNYEKEYKHIKNYIDNENYKEGIDYLTKLQEKLGEEINKHDQLIINVLLCVLQSKANKIAENLELIGKLDGTIKDQLMLVDFTLAKADTFYKVGKQQEAFNSLDVIEPLVEKIKHETKDVNTKENFDLIEREADLQNVKGVVLFILGEVLKSQTAFQQALSLRGILGNKKNFASALNNLGNIFIYKGELDFALDHHSQALEIRKELPNKSELASSYGNMGAIYHYMGNYENALDYFKQALTIFESINHKLFLAQVYYQLIRLEVEYNHLPETDQYITKLKDLDTPSGENPYIHTFFTLSEGMILKNSDRLMKKFKAGENFLQIANGPVIDSDLTVQAIFNLSDILLFEMRLSQNDEILNEVQTWSTKVIQLAEEQNSAVLIVQSCLLDSKLKLLDFKFNEARDILLKAQETANKKGIMKFEYLISRELDQLLSQEEKWEDLRVKGASLIERIDLTGLEETLNNLIRTREEFSEIEVEDPVLFLILLEGGLSAFSSKYKTDITLDEQLIAGFMSAVNTFGQQVFSTTGSVERIKHGEFTIISKKMGSNLTFCYAFKGPSYLPIKKLDRIVNELGSSDIFKTMIQKIDENQLLEGEEEEKLQSAINNIILETSEKKLVLPENSN